MAKKKAATKKLKKSKKEIEEIEEHDQQEVEEESKQENDEKKQVEIKKLSPKLKKEKEEILKFQEGLNKEYKDKIFFKGDSDKRKGYDRFSTGSFMLDYALAGGVPLHRVTAFMGEQSTSKTTIAKKIMVDAQHRCRETHNYIPKNYIFNEKEDLFVNEKGDYIEPYRCAFIDLEGTYDAEWFEALGGIDELVYKSYPKYGEQAVDIVQKFILSGFFDVIVIDSLAAMTPIKEIEASAEDDFMGLQARLINSACRKWVSVMKDLPYKKQPTIIMINQIRQKIGVMFGPNETVPGGLGQRFITSVEVRTRKGKVEYLDKNRAKTLSFEMHGIVEKNKTAPAKKEYSFRLAAESYIPPKEGDKKYPIAYKKGDILEHVEIIKKAHEFNLMGKIEKEGYFINLIDQDPIFYERKTDLLNEWVYQNTENYRILKENLLKVMSR